MKSGSFACPICNGFHHYHEQCPQCGNHLNDEGRLSDFYMQYSPYRPIDDLKMTDGYIDMTTHQCPHLIYCEQCNYMDVKLITEISL
ncbi:hypothetical protein [Hazenella coriacea]|uniref:Uncharacterized protein n=1 Tax=Hazenella coriacea TaxID=1179467 RepID=A0A4V2UVS1_9BACL|nr:hypothetical protein [Hazenella coriacea]TCS96897.1 hypothetical protein EDD58_101544 [Hazenella coriacea]